MKRLLFLFPGPIFPTHLPMQERYRLLSHLYHGDVIAPIWGREYKTFTLSNFKLHGFPWQRYPHISKKMFLVKFVLNKSIELNKYNQSYDVIVSYDPFFTGFLAFLISKTIGVKFITEVNGVYTEAFKLDSPNTKFIDDIKAKLVLIVTKYVLKKAHYIKLLFENQLASFNESTYKEKYTCFHDFVPISHFKESRIGERFILFLGHPWFLKGADILIKAFNLICKDFPDYTLKIVGYCPDRSFFEKLAGGNRQIQFCNPVLYQDAIKLITRCSIFVLPARTEGMGRVLLEAMASKKPIIASNVGGIPTYIKHDRNGLLFQSENIEDLAEKMRLIMSDYDYAQTLAENGYRYVFSNFSEECYISYFKQMIDKILCPSP